MQTDRALFHLEWRHDLRGLTSPHLNVIDYEIGIPSKGRGELIPARRHIAEFKVAVSISPRLAHDRVMIAVGEHDLHARHSG